MTHGSFFHLIRIAVAPSQAHCDLLSLLAAAEQLQEAVTRYESEYGKDLAAELFDSIQDRLSPEDIDGYGEQIRDDLQEWCQNTSNDVQGFGWALDNFTARISSQIYHPVTPSAETDTELDDSTADPSVLVSR